MSPASCHTSLKNLRALRASQAVNKSTSTNDFCFLEGTMKKQKLLPVRDRAHGLPEPGKKLLAKVEKGSVGGGPVTDLLLKPRVGGLGRGIRWDLTFGPT